MTATDDGPKKASYTWYTAAQKAACLRDIRQHGWSQTCVADMHGVRRRTVSNWCAEAGLRKGRRRR